MSKVDELVEMARELPPEAVENLLHLARELKRQAPHRPARQSLTPKERAKQFHEWANQERPPAPSLSDELLRREHLYE
jgi:hypothetical protein